MRVSTETTQNELSEAIRLNRGSTFWVQLLLRNLYSIFLLVIVAWLNISRFASGRPFLPSCLILLLLPVLFIWLRWSRIQAAQRNAFSKMNDVQGFASIDANGISTSSASGATSFVPWRDFSGWKEGKDVFTLTKAKSFQVLSKRGLSETELGDLRSLLRTQIR
jgi:YcxB-like protein